MIVMILPVNSFIGVSIQNIRILFFAAQYDNAFDGAMLYRIIQIFVLWMITTRALSTVTFPMSLA
jgi:hypothetical protein